MNLQPIARLVRERRGASAVEFALISPILLGLMVGSMNLGIYYFAQQSVSNALEEAARQAPIYPRPTDAQLRTTFSNALLKTETTPPTLGIAPGTTSSGVQYIDLSVTYSVPINLIFVTPGTYPVSANRRVFLPK